MSYPKYGVRLLLALLFITVWAPNAHAQQAGTMRYNAAAKQYEFYDGTRWYYFGLGIALGACTNEAAFEYDPLLVIPSYKFCNGTNWIRIVGITTLAVCSQARAIDYRNNSFMYCDGLFWNNMKGAISPSV